MGGKKNKIDDPFFKAFMFSFLTLFTLKKKKTYSEQIDENWRLKKIGNSSDIIKVILSLFLSPKLKMLWCINAWDGMVKQLRRQILFPMVCTKPVSLLFSLTDAVL